MQLHDPPPQEGAADGGKTGNKPPLTEPFCSSSIHGNLTKSDNLHKASPRPASLLSRQYAQNINAAVTRINAA